eukprot:262423_1
MPFGLYLVSLVAWIQCCDSSTSNIGQNVSFDLTLVYDAYSTCHRYFGTTNHTITTLDALNEIFVSTWIVYSDIISPPNSTLFNVPDSFVVCSKTNNSATLTTHFIVEFITNYEEKTFTAFSRRAATSIHSYCNHTVYTLIYTNSLVMTIMIVDHDQNAKTYQYLLSSLIIPLCIALCICGQFRRQYQKAFVVDQVKILIIAMQMDFGSVEREVERLSTLWGDKYNYDVSVLNPSSLYATKQDIIDFTDEHLDELSDEKYNAIIIHLIGHGSNDKLMTSDSKEISLDFFKHEMCQHFKGIKILFSHYSIGVADYYVADDREDDSYDVFEHQSWQSKSDCRCCSCTLRLCSNGNDTISFENMSPESNFITLYPNRRASHSGDFSNCIIDSFTQNVNKTFKPDFVDIIRDIGIRLDAISDGGVTMTTEGMGTIRFPQIRFEKCKTRHEPSVRENDQLQYHALEVREFDEEIEHVHAATECMDNGNDKETVGTATQQPKNTLNTKSYVEIERYVPERDIVSSANQQGAHAVSILTTQVDTHDELEISFKHNDLKSHTESYSGKCATESNKSSWSLHSMGSIMNLNGASDHDIHPHDTEIVALSLYAYMALLLPNYRDEGVACSGDQDSDQTYNNSSLCDHDQHVINLKDKHRQTHNKSTHQKERSDEDEDDDNKNQDNDHNPCNDSAQVSRCNHLNECTSSCKITMTRKNEQITFFRGLIESLYGVTESLQSQIDNHKLIYNAIISKCDSKSKRKRNRKPKQTATNIDLYPMRTIHRGKGYIQISKELTDNIIPDIIKETISNVYAYLDRSIAMQYNDGVVIPRCIRINSVYHEIINCDLHERKTNETLFCVVEKRTLNDRKMKNHLFTRDELSQFQLPVSSRTKLQNAEYNRIHNMFKNSNTQTWKDMLKACKWNQVPVFTQPEHKQRVTLSISIELLNKIVIHTMNNKPKLIPIVMFDETAHWMEYICVVHIQKDMDIGIALKYTKKHGLSSLKITGIHLDKAMILEQHELVLPHKCECFDGFKSTIDDIHVGNADDLLNKLKDYQKRYETLKQFVYWCRNDKEMKQYPSLQQCALVYLKNDNGSLGDSLVSQSSVQSLSSVSSSSYAYTHNIMHK